MYVLIQIGFFLCVLGALVASFAQRPYELAYFLGMAVVSKLSLLEEVIERRK